MSTARDTGLALSSAPVTTSPYTNPEQAVLRSNDPQVVPSSPPTKAAVCGIGCSGVHVARTMTSMSEGSSPALVNAARAALVASVADDCSGATFRRSQMPVFDAIQPASTPNRCSSSAFATTSDGTSAPQPVNRNGVIEVFMACLSSRIDCAHGTGAGERSFDLQNAVDGLVDGRCDRDEIERLAARLDVRGERLGYVLGRSYRAVALERREREPVEPLHRHRQSSPCILDGRSEATPVLHRVLPADRSPTDLVRVLRNEADRFPEPPRRVERADPPVAARRSAADDRPPTINGIGGWGAGAILASCNW